MFYIVYKTTNLINNKTYIGIHQTKNLDDGYLGSGFAMKVSIKKYGKENFSREILEMCSSYDELIEKEKIYVNEDWVKQDTNYNIKTGGQSAGLLPEESKKKISDTLKERYKNGEIVIKKRSYYPPNTEQQKQKISKTLREKYENGLIDRHLGRPPWNKGKKDVQVPWNKGTKGLQVGWCKGKVFGPKTDEQKLNQSELLKEYYKTHVHPTKGLEPWNKGVPSERVDCPYCGKNIDVFNAKRWHFENCKLKPPSDM